MGINFRIFIEFQVNYNKFVIGLVTIAPCIVMIRGQRGSKRGDNYVCRETRIAPKKVIKKNV